MILVDKIFGFDQNWQMTSPKVDHHTTMVSHAHYDHLPTKFKDKKLVCSRETEKIIRMRRNNKELNFWKDPNVKMLNAGHTIGSKMFHFQEQDILYTGDFNTQNKYCGTAKPVQCNTLIMEGTFGAPEYIFPKHELVVEQLVDYLKNNPKAIIRAYSFGKSQEICHILDKHKIDFKIESAPAKAINDELGLKFKHEKEDATVLLGPDHRIGFKSIAVSGWAIDPRYRFQMGVDAAFPLSDHADFPSLLQFAQSCNPKKIRVFHGGHHVELAHSLRKMGFDAEAFPVTQRRLTQFS
ncbi:MAG: hypothetical protein ABIA93_05995 [Candidatus Woesearchaeota archaeon]